jgi:hypothetical protein
VKRALDVVIVTLLSYALMELYQALRPPDLTDQIEEYLGTVRGKFEQFYAERQRRNSQGGSDDRTV